VAKSKKMN